MRINVDVIVQEQDSFKIIARREVDMTGVETPGEICSAAPGVAALVESTLESIARKMEAGQLAAGMASFLAAASRDDDEGDEA